MTWAASEELLAWLMDGDPAVRWQVMRDLLDAPQKQWRAQQARVATHGWGRRLLDQQNDDGNWGRGPYQPKWTCTTYTMQLLWKLGLPPRHKAALRACRVYAQHVEKDGGINFWRPHRTQGETCVTGMVLGQLSWFDGATPAVRDTLAAWLLSQQMEDGGWNCQRENGARCGSFHTTQSVMEGLHAYVELGGGGHARKATAALKRARAYFLAHRLYRSQRTGKIPLQQATLFHFPEQWRFDVLRGLDLFRAQDARPDVRLSDAMKLLQERRRANGRWNTAAHWPGETFFTLEKAGTPGRMVTLRALRVLRWWSAAHAG